jgi:hypothetical protein
MWRKAASVCMVVLVTAILMLIVVEWLVGCGEPVHKADGTWRSGECVFLPHEPATGRWR